MSNDPNCPFGSARSPEAAAAADAEQLRMFRRVTREWHERAVSLGYDGVADLLDRASPTMANGLTEAETCATASVTGLSKTARDAAERRLYELMSDISEECYCAGWMRGNEYTLWEMVIDPTKRDYGMGDVSEEQVAELKALSESLNGWVVWWDDDYEPEAPIETWGERFLPMPQWLALWNKFVAQRARHA